PPADGGLPPARLAERGRGRRAGRLAPAQPRRHQRRREPGRLADYGGRAGVPEHAASAEVTARGAPGRARARAARVWRGGDRSRARSNAGRCGRSRAARGPGHAGPRRAGRVRVARRVRRALRGDRSHRGALPGGGRGSSPAAPAAGCRARPRCPTPITRASAPWSTPSSRPRGGDFHALLALLDPDIVLRADPTAVQAGAAEEVRGAAAVAATFAGRARFAQPALVNGAVGLVWAPGGQPRVV